MDSVLLDLDREPVLSFHFWSVCCANRSENPFRKLFVKAFRLLNCLQKEQKTKYLKVAGAAGLEPVTSAVTGQRSNQLSYAPALRAGEAK